MSNLLLINGTIVNGENTPPIFGWIYIVDGVIKEISSGDFNRIFRSSDTKVLDCTGLVIAPGFIDLHSHNDLVPFMNDHRKRIKVAQGVTTELVGQCGLGVAPYSEEINSCWSNYIKGVVGGEISECLFPSFRSYLDQLHRLDPSGSYVALVSHGAIRTTVMGMENRGPSKDELNRMVCILDESLAAGAYGLSLGLQYMPGIFATRDELVALLKVVSHHEKVVMVHIKNHDHSILSAMDEVISIAKETNVKLHISHLRSYGSNVLGVRGEDLLQKVDESVAMGVSITFDEHVFLSGSTLLTQLLPPWAVSGEAPEIAQRLLNKVNRARIHRELIDPSLHIEGWDNYSLINGFENILITSASTPGGKFLEGLTLAQLAEMDEKSPIDYLMDLIISEGPGIGIVTKDIFSEEDLSTLLLHPLQGIGSDSIPAGRPHPRLYGNYPLFIGKYVREQKLLPLETAIYKSSGFAADLLKLDDRGYIRKGLRGDLVVFDLNTIHGYQDYMDPFKGPLGISYTIVKGEVQYQNSPNFDII